jgi:pyridoxal biosynthesis lyase PdxS
MPTWGDGVVDVPGAAGEQHDRHDVTMLLLAGAMQAEETIRRLQDLAALHRDADPTAPDQVAEAIATMTQIRDRLIRDADSIAHPPADW